MANETDEIIDLTDIIEQGQNTQGNDLFEENLDMIDGLDDPSLDELLSSIDNNSAITNLDDDFDSVLNNQSSNTPDELDEFDELDALLTNTPSPKANPKTPDEQDIFSEIDDLDTPISPKKAPTNEISLDDLDELLSSSAAPKVAPPVENNISMDDLDELLNSAPKAKQNASTAPEIEPDFDDLDALLNSEQFSAPKVSQESTAETATTQNDDLDILAEIIAKPEIAKPEADLKPANPSSPAIDPRIDELFIKFETQEKIITELKTELDTFKLAKNEEDIEKIANIENAKNIEQDSAKLMVELSALKAELDAFKLAKNEEDIEKTANIENAKNIEQDSAKLMAELSALKKELDAFKLAKNEEDIEKTTSIESAKNIEQNSAKLMAELSAEFAELTANLTNLEDKFELYKATNLTQIEALNTQNANLIADLQRLIKAQNNFELSIDQTVARAAAQIIQEEITAILNEEELDQKNS